jgi:hypothetical protein
MAGGSWLRRRSVVQPTSISRRTIRCGSNKVIKSFCFFFQKEALFFFEKKNQKTSLLLRTLLSDERIWEFGSG